MTQALLALIAFVAYLVTGLSVCLAAFAVLVATGQPISEQMGSAFTGWHFLGSGIATMCMTLVIHELGHFRAARRCGATVTRLELGPAVWQSGMGWRMRLWFSVVFPARVCIVFPQDWSRLSRVVWAGPLANLTTGTLSLLALPFSGPILQCWIGFFAVSSYGHFALSLLPFRFSGESTDGHKIWEAWRQRRQAARTT